MEVAVELTPEELERLVLSSLATADDVLWAQRAGVRTETFQVEGNATAWDYIVERVSQTGYTPSDVDLRTIGFEVEAGATDYRRFVNQLVEEDAKKRARAVLYRLAGNIEKQPFETIDLLSAELLAIRRGSQAHASFFDADALQRYDEVKRRKDLLDAGQRIGIPTGLPVFDLEGGDWQKGELATIMGTPGSGKSTLLIHFCVTAWAAGFRVLFISPENLGIDIHLRADPMVARLWGQYFENRALRTGRGVDLESYHVYTSSLAEQRRWKTVDSGEHGPFTINDIKREVLEFRPDVLAVDGVHLLTGPDATWQNIFHAGKVLKGLSQERELTTLAVCQVKSEALKSNEEVPSLGDASYGAKALMEDSNRVLAMALDRGGLERRSLKVKKWRDGPISDKKVFLTFRVNTGEIAQQEDRGLPTGAAEVIDFE